MNKQARVVFRGRVQGVWFRAFTSEAAIAEEITGWVRNLSDGSVEAIFEGEEKQVLNVIEKCRQGPPSALVETVETLWQEASGDFSSFDIRY